MSDPNPLDIVPEILPFDLLYGPPDIAPTRSDSDQSRCPEATAEMENERRWSRFGEVISLTFNG